jgi:chromosome segregation ATPase
MNEIKKTIKDMKEAYNKGMGTLKNNKSEINNSISQRNITIESLANRVEQAENRVSGTEDKVEELDQTVKDHERKNEWNMKDIWDTMKIPNVQIMGVEEGEEIQTKGINNLFNRIIAEKFPNLEKESHPGAANLQSIKPSGPKEKHPRHIKINTLSTRTHRKNTENSKREKTSHI